MAAITVTSLDDVGEHLRDEYEAQRDGTFRQKGTAGWESADAIKGLKSALGTERQNYKLLRRALGVVHGLGADDAAAFVSELQAITDDTAFEAAVAKRLGAGHKAMRAELEGLRATARDNAARVAIQAHAGNPALLLPVMAQRLRYDDAGKITVDGKAVADISAAVQVLKADAALSGAFAGSGNSGGGAGAGGGTTTGGGGTGAAQPRRGRMTAAEKASYISRNGGAAYNALPY